MVFDDLGRANIFDLINSELGDRPSSSLFICNSSRPSFLSFFPPLFHGLPLLKSAPVQLLCRFILQLLLLAAFSIRVSQRKIVNFGIPFSTGSSEQRATPMDFGLSEKGQAKMEKLLGRKGNDTHGKREENLSSVSKKHDRFDHLGNDNADRNKVDEDAKSGLSWASGPWGSGHLSRYPTKEAFQAEMRTASYNGSPLGSSSMRPGMTDTSEFAVSPKNKWKDELASDAASSKFEPDLPKIHTKAGVINATGTTTDRRHKTVFESNATTSTDTGFTESTTTTKHGGDIEDVLEFIHEQAKRSGYWSFHAPENSSQFDEHQKIYVSGEAPIPPIPEHLSDRSWVMCCDLNGTKIEIGNKPSEEIPKTSKVWKSADPKSYDEPPGLKELAKLIATEWVEMTEKADSNDNVQTNTEASKRTKTHYRHPSVESVVDGMSSLTTASNHPVHPDDSVSNLSISPSALFTPKANMHTGFAEHLDPFSDERRVSPESAVRSEGQTWAAHDGLLSSRSITPVGRQNATRVGNGFRSDLRGTGNYPRDSFSTEHQRMDHPEFFHSTYSSTPSSVPARRTYYSSPAPMRRLTPRDPERFFGFVESPSSVSSSATASVATGSSPANIRGSWFNSPVKRHNAYHLPSEDRSRNNSHRVAARDHGNHGSSQRRHHRSSTNRHDHDRHSPTPMPNSTRHHRNEHRRHRDTTPSSSVSTHRLRLRRDPSRERRHERHQPTQRRAPADRMPSSMHTPSHDGTTTTWTGTSTTGTSYGGRRHRR